MLVDSNDDEFDSGSGSDDDHDAGGGGGCSTGAAVAVAAEAEHLAAATCREKEGRKKCEAWRGCKYEIEI